MIEQCPQLIAKIQERNGAPTQNVQMISIEKRPVLAINVVTRSGATTQVQNKEKQLDKAWVRKTPKKIPAFNVGREKGTFMEAKKSENISSNYATTSTTITISRSFAGSSKYTVIIFTELYEAVKKSECFE